MDAKKRTVGADFIKPETLGSFATTILSYAISQGISLDEIAQVVDISELDYANQDVRLSDSFIGELMKMLADKFPDRAISIEVARSAPFSMFGGLVQGALFATDFEAVLNWFVGNTSIIADLSAVHLEKTASESALVLAHPSEFIDNGHTMEAAMGVMWRLLNTITVSGAPLQRVEFACKKTVNLHPYEEFFQAPITFQTGRNALIFSLDLHRKPIRSANPQMFDLIKQHFVEFRQKLNEESYPTELAKLRQSIMANAAQGQYGA
ncbi:MAG: AraC family transcriptional regulator ligand-binding domain-containing protein, partial [Cyanobacteria bacterium P01_F01_bin.33]